MYLGKFVEYGPANIIFQRPLHPYTKSLLSVIPIPNPTLMRSRKKIILKGEIPSPINPPSGCRFHTRCPYARKRCMEEEPELTHVGQGHFVSCLFWKEIEDESFTPQI
jgi:oligopeptide/dipeptide ABC transporter ATP-binding protein